MKKLLLPVSCFVFSASVHAALAGGFDNRGSQLGPEIGQPIYNTSNTYYNLLNSAWGGMHIYDNQAYQNIWGNNPDVNFSAWFKTRQSSYKRGGILDRRQYWGTYTSQCVGSLFVGITDQDLICRSTSAIKANNVYLLIAKPGENVWYLLNGSKNEPVTTLSFIGTPNDYHPVKFTTAELSRFNINGNRTVDYGEMTTTGYPSYNSYPVLFKTLPYDANNPDFVDKGDVSSWKIRANRGLVFVVPQGTGCQNPSVFDPLFGSDVNNELLNPNTRLLAMTWNVDFSNNAIRSRPNPRVMFDRLYNYINLAGWVDHGTGGLNYSLTAADQSTYGPAYGGISERYKVEYISNPDGPENTGSIWPWFNHTVTTASGVNISLSNANEVFVRILNSRFGGEASGINGATFTLRFADFDTATNSAIKASIERQVGPIADMQSFTNGDETFTWYLRQGQTNWDQNCYMRKYNRIAVERIESYKVNGYGVGRITHPDRGYKNWFFSTCAIASLLDGSNNYTYPMEYSHRYCFNNWEGRALELAPNYRPNDGNFNSALAPINPASRPLTDSPRYQSAKIGEWVPIPQVAGDNPPEVDVYSYSQTNRASYAWSVSGENGIYYFDYTNKGGRRTAGTKASNIIFGRFAGIDSPYWRAVNKVNSDSQWPGLQKYVYRVPASDVGGSIANQSPEGTVFPKGSVIIAIPKEASANSARQASSWVSSALFVTALVTGQDPVMSSYAYLNNRWSTSLNPGDFGGDGIHDQVYMAYSLDAASAFEPYAQQATRNGR